MKPEVYRPRQGRPTPTAGQPGLTAILADAGAVGASWHLGSGIWHLAGDDAPLKDGKKLPLPGAWSISRASAGGGRTAEPAYDAEQVPARAPATPG